MESGHWLWRATSSRINVTDLAHLPPDLRDHLFAFRYVCFEALKSLTPHATQCELKNSEQLQCRVVKVLRDAHPLGSANMLKS